jgi:hypothetical protein
MTRELEQMLGELESQRLEVVLVPLNPRMRNYNEGGMKRVCANKNPRWYSNLCNKHLSCRKRNHRKPDTKIKRANIVRILRRLCDGKPSISKYAEELRRIGTRVFVTG